MQQILEENKALIAAKNNYYTIIITISAGIVWLILSDVTPAKFVCLFLSGIYFDALYILRLQNADIKLYENIRRLE